jgi:hypothetical protein
LSCPALLYLTKTTPVSSAFPVLTILHHPYLPTHHPSPITHHLSPTTHHPPHTTQIYRRKLQHLLATSCEYNAERLLKILPPQFMHERALLLARLGRHNEVRRVVR